MDLDRALLEFKKTIKKLGLKYTPQRERVFKVIMTTRGHFEIGELVDRIKRLGIDVSRATVYRTLDILKELGYVNEVIKIKNKTIYEVALKEHHDHLICKSCGEIIEFQSKRIERLQNKICEEYGFQPHYHRLEIFGLCKRCQRKG